jgi:archaellum biogenesis ATPase FlaH
MGKQGKVLFRRTVESIAAHHLGGVLASFNVEKLFVSKIIQENSMTEVADVPPYFLSDSKYREAYEYIRKYYADIGTVPTARVFKVDCPDAVIISVEEPWEDIKRRVERQYIKGIINENMSKFNNAYDDDRIEDAINFLGVTLSKAHTAIPHSRDVDVSQNGQERLERYLERRNNPGTLVGVPTGFPTLDRATQGLQPGQLVTITGLAKTSKSTLALRIGMTIQEQGSRVLYLTYEQTVEEQERRLDAYRAGFNDNLLNSGLIDHDNWQKLQAGIKLTEELEPMMISEDCMTVTAIGAKADIFDPDVIIVDGTYMMDDENGESRGSPQALANIVSGLKFLAMRRSICVIAVTQSTPARARGETLNHDSIMGSRAFAQYSNTVIGIERTEETSMRRVKIMLSRSCAPCEIMLLFDYDTAEFTELEGFELDDNDQELGDEEYGTHFTSGFQRLE